LFWSCGSPFSTAPFWIRGPPFSAPFLGNAANPRPVFYIFGYPINLPFKHKILTNSFAAQRTFQHELLRFSFHPKPG
jgi:hypothetical protein